ncbi:DUF1266 domain-containing protein [Paenibacillus sp. alder61]|nr:MULTISPECIES: DUF1266 domain-containing protein [Paenibacillus]MCA1293852.1 DUF1266 domain-containing protein [Paenibacillus sp. alder61]
MTPTVEEMRKKWKPLAHAMLSFINMGPNAEYYIAHPEKMYLGTIKNKRILSEQHHIDTPEQLKQHLEWQMSVGLREEFDNMYQELILLPEAERGRRIASGSDPLIRHKMSVVNHYLRRMPAGGLTGYDCSFIVLKSLMAEQLKWLTGEEAWNYVGQAVKLARTRYGDWYDYCMSFAVGLEFYAIDDPAYYVRDAQGRLRRLLTVQDSPLVQVKLHH